SHCEAELDAFLDRDTAASVVLSREGARAVSSHRREKLLCRVRAVERDLRLGSPPHVGGYVVGGVRVVRQLHHIIKITSIIVAADLEDVHETLVSAGDRFEFLDAAEFTLVRSVMCESLPVDNFHSAIGAQSIPREPDFTVAAASDLTDEFVIGNICEWDPACRSSLRKVLRLVWAHVSSLFSAALRKV